MSSIECNRKDRESGFTLMELIVASAMSLMVISLMLQSSVDIKKHLRFESNRSRLAEAHQAGLQIIGSAIRSAGAALPEFLPAFVLTSSPTTELTIRESLFDTGISLGTCNALAAGTATAPIIAIDPSLPDCPAVSSYQAARTALTAEIGAASGNQLKAYMLRRDTREGEFVKIVGFTENGGRLSVDLAPGSVWSRAYPVGTSTLFFVREWRFRVRNGYLELIENQEENNPMRVTFGVGEMAVRFITSTNPTGVTQFPITSSWREIESINVTLRGTEKSAIQGLSLNRENTATFFPRNTNSQF